ncbi:MAG: alpha-L-fucosidase [bacterium]
MQIPNYLKECKELYQKNPRKANYKWFENAKYGLFLHYGLYSILGRHEWVQYREKIPVAEYAKLKDKFTAENFDAERIAAFASACGMNYINITTRHHDSFCLWDTEETDFNSVNSPAGRDLIKELVDACEKYDLALFLYYSHGRDWKHPHAPNNENWGGSARPEYDIPEPSYKYGEEHDLNIYLDFMENQITELLTNYPTIAGIWLDGIAVPMSGDKTKFKCQKLYDYIRETHPHVLISYKQGLLGTEDFFAPEHDIPENTDDDMKKGKIQENEKLIEICSTMIKDPVSWGYMKGAEHKSVEEVWKQLKKARLNNANLLINTGPLGEGSLDPVDVEVLTEVGKRINEEGFPGE